MFGLFKSEQLVKDQPIKEGYKIVPYRDEGFIIEKHEVLSGSLRISTLHDKVYYIGMLPSEQNLEDNIFIDIFSICRRTGTIRTLKTKDEAKKIIDEFIDKENEEKRAADEYKARVSKFAKDNPPEWYP